MVAGRGVCRRPEGGPQGREASFARRTRGGGRVQRVPGWKSRSGTPTAASCPRSPAGGRAQRGGPCREGQRVRAALGAPCPGPFQHPVCSLTGRQPSGRLAFLGWWLLPAHSRCPAPTPRCCVRCQAPGPGLRNRRRAWPSGWPWAVTAGAGDASPPRPPCGTWRRHERFLVFSPVTKEHVRAFLVVPC